MNLHKHQLYLLKQHSVSFKIWSAIIRINTERKSLIMKLGPVVISVIAWIKCLFMLHFILYKRCHCQSIVQVQANFVIAVPYPLTTLVSRTYNIC